MGFRPRFNVIGAGPSSAAPLARRAPIIQTLPLPRSKTRRRKKASAVDINAQPIASAVQQLRAKGSEDHAFELTILTDRHSPFMNAMRGRCFLPHSIPSSSKAAADAGAEVVLVFTTSSDLADDAKQAGADHVGGQELLPSVLDGSIVPTRVIATPDAVRLLTSTPTIARFLGPKGLMPSEKRGTVTADVKRAVQEARGGLDWRALPRDGSIVAVVGRIRQPASEVEANIKRLVEEVRSTAQSAATASKTSVHKLTLKTSQGPRISLLSPSRA